MTEHEWMSEDFTTYASYCWELDIVTVVQGIGPTATVTIDRETLEAVTRLFPVAGDTSEHTRNYARGLPDKHPLKPLEDRLLEMCDDTHPALRVLMGNAVAALRVYAQQHPTLREDS